MMAMHAARPGGSEKKKLPPGTLKRVIGIFAPYRWQLLGIGLLVVAASGMGLFQPLFLRKLVDEGLLKSNFAVVTRYSCWTLLFTVLGTSLGLASGYFAMLVGQRLMRDLRNRLNTHLQGMSLRFFSQTRTGEIQSRLTSDVGGVQGVLADTANSILANVTTLSSTLIIMFTLDWRLTMVSIGVVPLFAWVGARVGSKSRTLRTHTQKLTADLNSTMAETLSVSGILLIKTSGRRGLAMERFAKQNDALAESQIKLGMLMRVFFTMMQFTFSITPALVYWLAGYLIIRKSEAHLTLGTLIAFTGLQARVFFPLTTLLNTQVEVTSALALFDRIFQYLDMPQEIKDKPNAIVLDPAKVRGEVTFESVSFRYGPDQPEPTLSGVSLVARPGEHVALVGPSGAGKTTLTYLIPRLYDVVGGSVKIDGHDVRDVTINSLEQVIGVVTQESYLVHDTIRENLRYGRPEATDAEIIAAAQAAAIHDHIVSLPQGYDTVVGERGYKLSGGEKQRISIARVLLKDPPILILDEATSSLDTRSERLIQDAMERLSAGRTTFAIAHRLSTIRDADQILVMDKGHIIQRGTHDQLLAEGGTYAHLHAAQFREEPAVVPPENTNPHPHPEQRQTIAGAKWS
jgi:ATP-binding cassette subfamily B protein